MGFYLSWAKYLCYTNLYNFVFLKDRLVIAVVCSNDSSWAALSDGQIIMVAERIWALVMGRENRN